MEKAMTTDNMKKAMTTDNSAPEYDEATLSRKYLKADNLLILHLTDRCNNRCGFCMVDGIHGRFSFPYDAALTLMDTLPPGSKVDLFGGEPTMHPRFLDLLQEIRDRDLKCSVATNARLFAREDFCQAVVERTGRELYVRTSLHGLSAESHDAVTRSKGSFAQTMQGVAHILARGLVCQINIVVTKQTLPDLVAITRFVADNGVPMIKFGLIVDAGSCADMVPTLEETGHVLREAMDLAMEKGLIVTVEKAPLCLVPSHLQHFSTERLLGKWPRVFDDAGACGSCVVRKWCDGLDPEYAAIFGTAGIHRIDKLPRNLLRPFPEAYTPDSLRFLKLNLFAMPPDTMDRQTCETIMVAMLAEAKHKHARIAFVDNHIVR
jgi:pyruvate-formate lyase-activating enzyme